MGKLLTTAKQKALYWKRKKNPPKPRQYKWWNSKKLGTAISDGEGWYVQTPENKSLLKKLLAKKKTVDAKKSIFTCEVER